MNMAFLPPCMPLKAHSLKGRNVSSICCPSLRARIRTISCQGPTTTDAHRNENSESVPITGTPLLGTKASSTSPLLDAAVALAATWAIPSTGLATQLASDARTTAFLMFFVDRVMRPLHSPTAARLLRHLASTHAPPNLTPLDTLLFMLAVPFSKVLPYAVIPLAKLRTLALVSPFIDIRDKPKFQDGFSRNLNLLGEAVLGDVEAAHRRDEAIRLLSTPGVHYVSVKVSSIVPQLNIWDFSGSLARIKTALIPLFHAAKRSHPQVFINLDMEEYSDLHLTIAAFTDLLSEPDFQDLNAGIVLQTYLPDALPSLEKLMTWANKRPGQGEIKIRLVKGANLSMEKVDAEIHGWTPAPYDTKQETDANYIRCLDYALHSPRLRRVRIGVASHNLFLLAYAHLLATERNVPHRVGFEMLQGMTPSHTPLLSEQGHGMLLYTPVCSVKDFDVAISYLFRRFEETSSEGNFLHTIGTLAPNSTTFALEEARFRQAVSRAQSVSTGPRRMQLRPAPACEMTLKGPNGSSTFVNEPDTDPALLSNREWAKTVLNSSLFQRASHTSIVETVADMDAIMKRGRAAATAWGSGKGTMGRRALFSRIGDELAKRRGDLINAMVYEGQKTFSEADSEVSEAIDFATYYGVMGDQLPDNFEQLGVICVVAPWNFPVAIACGGAMAALAAGNAVILKPSHSTPRCAEIVAECAWAAGVPRDALQFVQCSSTDVRKQLIVGTDGVILTGSSETASLFRSWKSNIRLFAETSGKNSLIISPAADFDLAVADLVQSSFSNSGQRCSSSSLAICIGDLYNSDRFYRQLEDSVRSLNVGPATNIATVIGPLIKPPEGKLLRALTELDDGETWLVKPRCLDADGDGRLWTPGVKLGVRPGSWFHQTEVFGPVLGIMFASDLDEALSFQNGNKYGLTGGIHTLDQNEIDYWLEKAEVGNAYVNRAITGAIVQRQSFGGWKASVVGPGAKAGGPNYVAQFGTNCDAESVEHDEGWFARALESDNKEWLNYFTKEHDPSQLVCERNFLRYRALPGIAVRIAAGARPIEARRVRAAIERTGTKIVAWSEGEDVEAFIGRLTSLNITRVRVIGQVESEVLAAAEKANIHVSYEPVVEDGRFELLHYLREQSISQTSHRFGRV